MLHACGRAAHSTSHLRRRPAACCPPTYLQKEGKQWGQEGVGSWSDTSEAAIRAVMLAAR